MNRCAACGARQAEPSIRCQACGKPLVFPEEIHDPGNRETIDQVYVYMSIDDEGRHGIVGALMPALGVSGPLVTSSRSVANYMQPLAEDVARLTGKRVGLFVFKRDAQLWQS